MNILGISCFYHDSAAALIQDGEIVAAAQEEQKTLGFLRCPADPVGITFRNNNERLAYMREKGKEFGIKSSCSSYFAACRSRTWNDA